MKMISIIDGEIARCWRTLVEARLRIPDCQDRGVDPVFSQ